ncbi:hypothetical protein [uncultured Rikenella sp.]|uniref:hypothetical protein n=1 Tax=uncultured Rikenella sp. TaxID=368003 RepID=UPI00272CA09A|nr:hypothetical protein [uncultured Rikenella sp.]
MKAVKKESPAGRQGQSVEQHKGSRNFRMIKPIRATVTQRRAYASTAALRLTEEQTAKRFFGNHPQQSFSRADLSDEFNLPINHICRIARNLLDVDFIEVVGCDINPRSNRPVQMLQLNRKEGNHE